MKTIGNKEIYESPEEIMDPEHTLLINWDLQNGLVKNVFNKDEFVKNVKSLNENARKIKMPVAYTKITPLPFLYMSPAMISNYMQRFHVDDPSKLPAFMAPGSEDAEIYNEFKPEKDDYIFNKNTASIFVGTNVENMLKSAGIKTLIFTGIATEIGVESSVRDSINYGYYTVVASDSCSSSNRENHEAALKSMSSVSMVMKTSDIINVLKKY